MVLIFSGNISNVIDILVFIFLIYLVFRFIKNTEALKVAVGILVVFLLSVLASLLHLERTSSLLSLSTHTLTLAAVYLFSPELRKFLKSIAGFTNSSRVSNQYLKVIEDSLFELSAKKTGALIIIDENGTVASNSANSTLIDSKLNSNLLCTIFQPTAPLHDGAVLISKSRIKYAGSKLPLSAIKREDFGNLGTRHMVAIETAEAFNVLVFVVSEETGEIRIASGNTFTLINSKADFRTFFENYESTLKK